MSGRSEEAATEEKKKEEAEAGCRAKSKNPTQ